MVRTTHSTPSSGLESPRRGRRLAWMLFVYAVLAAGALVPIGTSYAPRLGRSIADASHLPAFALLTWFLAFSLEARTRRPLAAAALLAAVTAAVVEVLQAFVGRTPSLRDLGTGWLGIAVAVALLATHRRGRRALSVSVTLVALALCAVVAAPIGFAWRTHVWQRDHYPSLGEFERPSELRLWSARGGPDLAESRIGLSAERATRGSHALRIETEPGDWGGVEYEGGRTDWSGFRSFTFSVVNPGEPFEVYVRLEEACRCRKPRASTSVYVAGSGESRVWVPLEPAPRDTEGGAPLDLSRIGRFALFTGEQQPARVWYLDEVRLER